MAREIKIEGKKDNNGIIDIEVPESEREYIVDVACEQIPVGAKHNGIEVVKSQTNLDEYEDDTDEEAKPRSILKAYQKDVVENDIKKKLSKNVLTPEEEAELKEKFIQEKTDEIMKNIEDLSKTYVPKENIDTSKKINDLDIIRATARLFGFNFENAAERYKKAMEATSKDIARAYCCEKKEYKKPECNVKECGLNVCDTPCNAPANSFDRICMDIVALHRIKNADYGNAAHESFKEFGITSYVIRLNDKLNRLKTLTKPGVTLEVKDESIIDTLKDLAAYSIMTIESLLNE